MNDYITAEMEIERQRKNERKEGERKSQGRFAGACHFSPKYFINTYEQKIIFYRR